MAYKDFYDLDYSSIKSRLKIFLKEQTELTDYNFEGSGISNWLNIMSYVISYIGAVLNFVANEMFISTAQKESNILKIAYQLNYLPRRKSAPSIILTFHNTHTSSVTIPIYTKLQMGEINLVFLGVSDTVSDLIIEADTTETAVFYEGEWVTKTHVAEEEEDYETIALDHKATVDWDNFSVQVADVDGSTVWNSVYDDDNYTDANNYFIKYFDEFAIQFDKAGGMFSKPAVGDDITIQYLNTNGDTYNGYSYSTQLVFSVGFANSDKLTVSLNNQVLSNGLAEESLESISNNAPLFYSASGRAVTEGDYNIKIKSMSLYHNLHDMFVYSSHKDFVDRQYENPTELLTNDSKRDLGYYIYGGVYRDLEQTMDDRYTLMNSTEIQAVKDFFEPFKYMQTFGKFKHSHIWYTQLRLDVKLISDLQVEETVFKNTLNTELENSVGYEKSFNLSQFIAYVKSFSYVDYCKVSYTNVVRLFPPRIKMTINEYIEYFNVGDSISGNTSGVAGTVVRVDTSKNSITVERTGVGMFIEGEIITNSTTGYTTPIDHLYKSIVCRIGMEIEPQSILSKDANGILDDGIGNIKIGTEIIGTVNYTTGYIQFEYDFDDEFIELLFETVNYEKINARLDMFLDFLPLVNNAGTEDTGINYL